MHPALRILLLVPALTGWAVADLPRKAPLNKYSSLWANSPFTSKPPPPEAGPAINPLEDYVLAGVSPISSGYRVTLLNKKKPEEMIITETDNPKEGFKILEVIRKPGDPLGTVVRMSSGGITGTVSFDEAALALKSPPAAAPPQQSPPPGIQPQPANGQPVLRQPRPRVVPPPPAVIPQPNTPQAGRPPTVPQPTIQRPDRRR